MYVKKSFGYDIQFQTMTTSPKVVDFIDSEQVRCIDDMKSNSRYAFTLENGVFS